MCQGGAAPRRRWSGVSAPGLALAGPPGPHAGPTAGGTLIKLAQTTTGHGDTRTHLATSPPIVQLAASASRAALKGRRTRFGYANPDPETSSQGSGAYGAGEQLVSFRTVGQPHGKLMTPCPVSKKSKESTKFAPYQQLPRKRECS